MSVGQVMDLTVICHSFPEIPIPQIDRDNLLNLFIKIFSGDTELLVVEGDEEIGKTILLAQFATKQPLQVFSLFIKSTSRWAYDPESLRFDLCNQIHWLLHGTELDTNEGVDDTFLRRSWSSLRRYAIQRKKTLFFIVDGLDEIPEEESQTRKIILDMLPFGFSAFRFLVSGEPDKILQNVNQKVHHKTHILAGFNLEETIEYLKDLPFEREIIRELYNLCGGNPGYLASMRRILESDFDVHTLLDEMPDKLPRLFEVEWKRANIDDAKQKQLLAFMAFARKGYTLSDLSRILTLSGLRSMWALKLPNI